LNQQLPQITPNNNNNNHHQQQQQLQQQKIKAIKATIAMLSRMEELGKSNKEEERVVARHVPLHIWGS
jgi:hypothetical protein